MKKKIVFISLLLFYLHAIGMESKNRITDKIAPIIVGNTISSREYAYLQKRNSIIRTALERSLACDLKNKKTPTIACVFSGGGYRSMLATLGSMRGLEKEGLLDCTTYTVSLSGSTWALAPWFSTQQSLEVYTAYIHNCVQNCLFDLTPEEECLLASMIAVKALSNQPLTLVDPYGGLLGNNLLRYMNEKRHMIYLSEQANTIKEGSHPYPIYTAISGNKEDNEAWYTFTPHRVANITYNISIPTWGCGRHYNEKRSIDNVPELPLSVLLGTWGSAFAADYATIINGAEEMAPQYKLLLEKLHNLIRPIENERPIPCELKLPNFTKGKNTPLSRRKNLQLVDAGIKINLPYPALKDRNPDVIMFFDNSAGPLGEELQKCAEYAHSNKMPFPPIDLENIDKKTISIFTSDNAHDPLVLYFPGISDPHLWDEHKTNPLFKKYHLSDFDLKKETEEGFCETIRFQYLAEHARLVTAQTEFNLRANTQHIKEAISWKINTLL